MKKRKPRDVDDKPQRWKPLARIPKAAKERRWRTGGDGGIFTKADAYDRW